MKVIQTKIMKVKQIGMNTYSLDSLFSLVWIHSCLSPYATQTFICV